MFLNVGNRKLEIHASCLPDSASFMEIRDFLIEREDWRASRLSSDAGTPLSGNRYCAVAKGPESVTFPGTPWEGWSYVKLPGTGHVIPFVCPNCLAPGTVPVRYQRVMMSVFGSLLYPFSFFPFDRRSLQTFYYCKACAEEARAETRRGRVLEVFCSFPVQMLLVLAPIVPLFWLAPLSWVAEGKMLLLGMLLILSLEIPIMIYLGRWIAKASLRRAMRLYPQRTGQAAWGHAVYYVSPYPVMNWIGGYDAARPEWIRALVEANPGGVSDETYRQWTS